MYRIAFFGSDLFSLVSFKEILKLRNSRPDLISELSLVTRQLKASGRGMRNIAKPPIVEFAESQAVQWHQIEAQSEFNQLQSISNLAIAVSYGRLIPASYLKALKYGGLNVHPSLLPEYRGSSPLQYAIMDQRRTSGVSVQTLHPTKFDHGEVLWQSGEIELDKRETTPSLGAKLGDIGAAGLCEVLENVDLANPPRFTAVGGSARQGSYAPLIPRAMQRVEWNETAEVMDARGRALEKLFFEQNVEQKPAKRGRMRGAPVVRVNLSKFTEVTSIDHHSSLDGKLYMGRSARDEVLLCLKMANDSFLGAAEVTVQGLKTENAESYFAHFEKRRLRAVVQ